MDGIMSLAISAVLIIALLTLAGVHLYWGLGGRWPGTDEVSLVEHVVGRTPDMKMPNFLACSVVAGGLLGICFLLLARLGAVALPWGLGGLVPIGLWAAATIFVLRGAAGFAPRVFDYAKGTPFHALNTTFYAPLCLALGLGIVAINFSLPKIT